jgi:hypothetical protein
MASSDNLLFDFSQTADLDDEEVAASVSPKLDCEKIIALNAEETALELVEAPVSANGKEPEQIDLLHLPEWWREHWKGMPEFVQNDLTPFATIYVHFENREDMSAFSKLVNQTITSNTRAIWYPAADIDETAKLRWISEPKAPNGKKDELREILDSE